MGHKGVRDSGPARRPGFRPADVIGLPIRQALIELAHEGFTADICRPDDGPHDAASYSDRVRLTVDGGVVHRVVVG